MPRAAAVTVLARHGLASLALAGLLVDAAVLLAVTTAVAAADRGPGRLTTGGRR